MDFFYSKTMEFFALEPLSSREAKILHRKRRTHVLWLAVLVIVLIAMGLLFYWSLFLPLMVLPLYGIIVKYNYIRRYTLELQAGKKAIFCGMVTQKSESKAKFFFYIGNQRFEVSGHLYEDFKTGDYAKAHTAPMSGKIFSLNKYYPEFSSLDGMMAGNMELVEYDPDWLSSRVPPPAEETVPLHAEEKQWIRQKRNRVTAFRALLVAMLTLLVFWGMNLLAGREAALYWQWGAALLTTLAGSGFIRAGWRSWQEGFKQEQKKVVRTKIAHTSVSYEKMKTYLEINGQQFALDIDAFEKYLAEETVFVHQSKISNLVFRADDMWGEHIFKVTR